MNKIDIDNINLKITEVTGFYNGDNTGIIINWDSDIGFGEYTIYQSCTSNLCYIESECMDSDDDKSFGKKLLELLLEKAGVRD